MRLVLVLCVLWLAVPGWTAFAQGERAAPAPQEGRRVPARVLPAPVDAGAALRADSMTPLEERLAAARYVPRSTAEWKSVIAASGELAMAETERLRARLGVAVEERRVAGVRVFVVTPPGPSRSEGVPLVVHAHGGGYVFLGGKAGLPEAMLLAHYAQAVVYSVDYRQPPDHPFPAALEDMVAVWRELAGRFESGRMALAGSSAGGGLVLAATLKLKALGLPVPGAVFAGTPWADLSGVGDSRASNAFIDNALITGQGFLDASAKLYAGTADLRDPFLSPVYGEYADFPPTILASGTRDLFLSDTVRVHRRLLAAGVIAELLVVEGLSHAGYLRFPEEERFVFGEVVRFFQRHLLSAPK